MRLRIGITASIFHEDRARVTFNGRPLVFIEASMGRWVGTSGALPLIIPPPTPGHLDAADYAASLDGLVVSGGVDVAPEGYGESPIKPEWAGDAVRDAYEIALVRAFFAANKPILGICRGHQVLNVAFGGSLLQDITHQKPGSLVHRRADIYEKNQHDVAIRPGSRLAEALGTSGVCRVNSVHHQAVARVAEDFDVDATSTEDGVIEAISYRGDAWVRGVQWHPEFVAPDETAFLDDAPLLRAFLDAARARRDAP